LGKHDARLIPPALLSFLPLPPSFFRAGFRFGTDVSAFFAPAPARRPYRPCLDCLPVLQRYYFRRPSYA